MALEAREITPTELSRDDILKLIDDPLERIETSDLYSGSNYAVAIDVPHRALFNFYEWNGISQRLVGGETSNPAVASSSVSLPMPGNLETTYGVNYSEESAGGLTAGILNAVGGGNLTESLTQAGTGIIGDFLNKFAIGQIGTAQIGIARNPHQVVLLQGVDFRTFQFNYRFSPQSRQEALDLRNLIKKFKYAMSVGVSTGEAVRQGLQAFQEQGRNIVQSLPDSIRSAAGSVFDSVSNIATGPTANQAITGAAKNFFTYPDYFEIDFYHNNNPSRSLFRIGPCVLTSFNVQYHPNSIPSYATPFGGDDRDPTPTEVHLNMNFKELEIITRDRIDGGR